MKGGTRGGEATREVHSWPAGLTIAGLGVLTLALHAGTYLPFICDDALISLRYAERLLQGHGLTWTDGQRVEGYTNLLWILCCATLGWAGLDLIDAARVIGFAGAGAAVLAVVYAHWPRRASQAPGAFAGAGSLALAGPVAAWTVGGLEQPLLIGLLCWAATLCYPLLRDRRPGFRQILVPSALLGLICLTRADGVVICAALGLGFVFAHRRRGVGFSIAARLAIFPVLLTLGQLLLRVGYYGDWLPNPARVKVALAVERLLLGARYVLESGPYLAGLWLAAGFAVLGGLAVRELRRKVVFLFVPLAAWTAYLVLIGGDIFPARRHLVVNIALSAMLFALFVDWLAARGPTTRRVAWIGASALLGVLAWGQRRDPQNRLAREEVWEWDGQLVGRLLRAAFADKQPLLACDTAGCLPYFSKLPALDMLGLNDRQIAGRRPPGFGHGWLGHELGDGKYVLACEPDLIVFQRPRGVEFSQRPSGRAMQADPRFFELYRLVFLEGHDPRLVPTMIWMRADSQKIGIHREPGRIVVPGYFAASSLETPARLDRSGRLGTVVFRGSTATLPALQLPGGRWRLSVMASDPLPAEVRVGGACIGRADGEYVVEFELKGDPLTSVDVELLAGDYEPVYVYTLVFERGTE